MSELVARGVDVCTVIILSWSLDFDLCYSIQQCELPAQRTAQLVDASLKDFQVLHSQTQILYNF